MTGIKETSQKLNKTLSFIITLLNNNNIGNWFICYGTLLGLVRENSCIENDDDVDIIININDYEIVAKILIENNFYLDHVPWQQRPFDTDKIIKTIASDDYASIDIYSGDFKDDSVFDLWNGLNIKDCYFDKDNKTFIEKQWNGQTIYYPNNYERILKNRYGDDWTIKKDQKIPQSMEEL